MRMIHIVGDSAWGGGGPIILALADMARSEGWTVDMLTTDPVCKENATRAGLGVVDLDVIWRDIRPLRDLTGLMTLAGFLRRNSYSLVHTHTSKAGFVGRIAARLAGIPAILHTVHGFPFHEQSGRLTRTIYVVLERTAAHFCDRIVTVSNYHRDWALRLRIGSPGRVVAIPNGVADPSERCSKSSCVVRAELGLNPDTIMILATGRLSTQKGYEYLIDAAAILKSKVSRPFRIILAGGGPLRSALEGRAEQLGCVDQVTFLGFRTDVPDLLNACDILALPSLYEGMSISLLEAMAVGKPIVATSIGGNLEPTQNGRAALIVPPKDPNALADALASFVNDNSLAREKARTARRVFLEEYTLSKMVNGYERIYRDLVLKTSVAWPAALERVGGKQS